MTIQAADAVRPGAFYDSAFFEEQRDQSRASASIVVPLFLEKFPVHSVADIGCGVGGWLAAFRENGVERIAGFDGDYVDRSTLYFPAEAFTPVDLENPPAFGRHDAVCTLEVAEHLPESAADPFVARLAEAAPVVLFSAAIPGQAGTNHINCQWPSYWAEKFATHGFVPVDFIRWQIWSDERIPEWYRQNILVFCRPDRVPAGLASVTAIDRLDIVHPAFGPAAQAARQAEMPPRSITQAVRRIGASLVTIGDSLGVIARRILARLTGERGRSMPADAEI